MSSRVDDENRERMEGVSRENTGVADAPSAPVFELKARGWRLNVGAK
jgi:hypothetical protein